VATLSNVSLTGINVGTYPTGVSATFAGDSSFGSSTGSASLTINQKGLTVTGITANNRVYDGTTAATLNVSGAALVGVVGTDNVNLNAASAIGTFASKTVATGKTVTVAGLTLGGTSAANYSLTQPTATADITAKALTVTGITANNKTYDGGTTATLITTGASLVGVISGDTVALSTTGAAGAFGDKT